MLAEALETEARRVHLGNPGTTELLTDALIGRKNIRYIKGLQEACVVAMADGYAQASGKPGVINPHTAGGLGRHMGNLLNARTSGTLLVVTVASRIRAAIADPLLQGDLVAIANAETKRALEVTAPEQLPSSCVACCRMPPPRRRGRCSCPC
ncbi:MAG: thiamine pyrophosphate-binding protein [Rhodocyclaceae bacterium]